MTHQAPAHWTAEPGFREEDMRFLRSLHDFFIAIGVAVFLAGIAVFTASSGGGSFGTALVVLLAGLAIAEYVGRRRRLFFPTLVILFASAVSWATLLGSFTFLGADRLGDLSFSEVDAAMVALRAAGTALLFGLGAFGFFWRHRFPATLALLPGAASVGVFGLLSAAVLPGLPRTAQLWFHYSPLQAIVILSLFAGGVAGLIGGVLVDSKDPERRTWFSDLGFWLHAGSAPLLVAGIATLAAYVQTVFNEFGLGETTGPLNGPVASTIVLLGVTGVAVLGLALDRRALVVSGLTSFAGAVAYFLSVVGLEAGALVGLTLLLMGAAIALLGVGWRPTRGALLKSFPQEGVWARVFPPNAAA